MGVDFHQRGKIMEQSLEIINRLWTEDEGRRRLPALQAARRRALSQARAEAAPAAS